MRRAAYLLFALGIATAVPAAGLLAVEPIINEASAMAPIAPQLVGLDGPRRYLVLAQNPAELRPTGGYIGTVGVVAIARGRIVDRAFQDVYYFDLRPGIPYVAPPQPLANHLLGASSWQLADANWSPDFPTAAQQALRLYTLESGDAAIDGVIALNTFAVDSLLEAIGPVTVPGYDVTVAPGEVTMTAIRLTRGVSTPDSDRKAFLSALADAVFDRLAHSGPLEWPRIYGAFSHMRANGDLLIWLADPAAEDALRDMPLGGALSQAPGDYVYVVEANVAPTSKFNLVVGRTDELDVSLAANGDATSQLRMTWHNDALLPGEPYASLREFSTSTDGFYGAYVRVLRPLGSVLRNVRGSAADQIDRSDDEDVESGRAFAGNYLLMPPGASTLDLQWTTTGVATQSGDTWTYLLTVEKQPGLRPMPLNVSVTLPPSALVDGLSAGAAALADGTVRLETVLEEDLTLEVRYRIRE